MFAHCANRMRARAFDKANYLDSLRYYYYRIDLFSSHTHQEYSFVDFVHTIIVIIQTIVQPNAAQLACAP